MKSACRSIVFVLWEESRQQRARHAYCKRRRLNDPGRYNESSKRWRDNNPGYSKQWRDRNPAYHREYRKRMRQRIKVNTNFYLIVYYIA